MCVWPVKCCCPCWDIHLPFSLPVQLILIIICMFVPTWFLYSLSESTVLWPQLPRTVCSVDLLCSFISYRAFVSKNVTILSVYMSVLPKSYKPCTVSVLSSYMCSQFYAWWLSTFCFSKSCPPHLHSLPILVCIFFFLNKQDIKVLKIYCKQFMHLILVPVCSRVVIDLMFWQQCIYGLHQYAEHKTYACVLLCSRSRKKQLEMRQSNTSFVYISIC